MHGGEGGKTRCISVGDLPGVDLPDPGEGLYDGKPHCAVDDIERRGWGILGERWVCESPSGPLAEDIE
jgi:hypothetical protein